MARSHNVHMSNIIKELVATTLTEAENMKRAQNKYKTQHDKNVVAPTFSQGLKSGQSPKLMKKLDPTQY